MNSELQLQTDQILKGLKALNDTLDWMQIQDAITVALLLAIALILAFKRK